MRDYEVYGVKKEEASGGGGVKEEDGIGIGVGNGNGRWREDEQVLHRRLFGIWSRDRSSLGSGMLEGWDDRSGSRVGRVDDARGCVSWDSWWFVGVGEVAVVWGVRMRSLCYSVR